MCLRVLVHISTYMLSQKSNTYLCQSREKLKINKEIHFHFASWQLSSVVEI